MFKIVKQKEEKLVIEKSKFFGYIFNCNSLENQTKILKEVKKLKAKKKAENKKKEK